MALYIQTEGQVRKDLLSQRPEGPRRKCCAYKASPEGERKYSPAEISSVEEIPIMGRPDPARICTSIVERQNPSVRMGTRRFTRLTNAFSKKWENHWAAVSTWFVFYNFCRVHKSLRVTPAMAAGISNHVWDVRELLEA